jgi:DNA-binding response OmpR family regulator
LTVAGFTLDAANNVLRVNSDKCTPLVIPLTTKEFQLLMYLMQNPNRIIPGSKLRHHLANETSARLSWAYLQIGRTLEPFDAEITRI